jgi:hypothetical protein
MLLDAGGTVIEILESTGLGPSTKADLDAWINAVSLKVTSLKDPDDAGTTVTLDTYGIRETVFLVDLSTMKIVDKYNGSLAGAGTSAVGQAIPTFLMLLGH